MDISVNPSINAASSFDQTRCLETDAIQRATYSVKSIKPTHIGCQSLGG